MYRLVTFRLPPSTGNSSGSKSLDAQAFESQLAPGAANARRRPPGPLCHLIHQCLSYQAPRRPERVSEILDVLNVLVESLVQKPEDSLEAMEW